MSSFSSHQGDHLLPVTNASKSTIFLEVYDISFVTDAGMLIQFPAGSTPPHPGLGMFVICIVTPNNPRAFLGRQITNPIKNLVRNAIRAMYDNSTVINMGAYDYIFKYKFPNCDICQCNHYLVS